MSHSSLNSLLCCTLLLIQKLVKMYSSCRFILELHGLYFGSKQLIVGADREGKPAISSLLSTKYCLRFRLWVNALKEEIKPRPPTCADLASDALKCALTLFVLEFFGGKNKFGGWSLDLYPSKRPFCLYLLHLYMCATDAAGHRDRCRPLNYGLLPPLCGIIRQTVVSPDRGLRLSLAYITERKRVGERERESVCLHTCTCAMCSFVSVLVWVYSSYESQCGGYNASVPSTTNVYRLTLFQVYNHIPYGVSFAHDNIEPALFCWEMN